MKLQKKPKFNILYEDFNKNEIRFVNWFDFGQWSVIKKELTKLIVKMKKLDRLCSYKIGFGDIQPEIKKFFEKEVWNVKYKRCKNLDELIEYAVESRLDHLCTYYFWAKCEYEVIVSSWPPRDGSERKIDIYTQLKENWHIFRELVFKELKLDNKL